MADGSDRTPPLPNREHVAESVDDPLGEVDTLPEDVDERPCPSRAEMGVGEHKDRAQGLELIEST